MKLNLKVKDHRRILGIFFLVSFFLEQNIYSEIKTNRVTDVFNSALDVLNFNFTTQLSEFDLLKSNALKLKFDVLPLPSELFGEAQECRIGRDSIPGKSVRILFDRLTTLRLERLQQPVQVEVQIDNPSHLEGGIACGHLGIFAAGNRMQIVELRLFGEAVPSPMWKVGNNGSGKNVNFLQLNFSGQTSQTTVHAQVDSQSVTVALEHALSNPAQVIITPPQNCKIGSTNVRDLDVALVVGNQEFDQERLLFLSSGKSQNMLLRFKSEGLYGKKHGSVQCDTNGSLVYAY